MIVNSLYKCKYLIFNYSVIFYLEINCYYLLNISSARKFNESFRFFIFLEKNEVLKYIPIFLYRNNKYKHWGIVLYDKLLERNKFRYFKEVMYESKGKIKIIGRGWKIIKYSYQLLIKLGFSHNLFLELSPILKYKLKKKKKKYYTFYSIFYNDVNSLLNKFRLLRVPDVYTRKGIFHRRIML
jgi:hypothetical protein